MWLYQFALRALKRVSNEQKDNCKMFKHTAHVPKVMGLSLNLNYQLKHDSTAALQGL